MSSFLHSIEGVHEGDITADAGHPTTFLTSCHREMTDGQMYGIWDALGKSKPKKIAGTARPSSCFAMEATRELSQTSLGTCLREMSSLYRV